MSTLRQASAGQLRHRVAFERRAKANDGGGTLEGGFVRQLTRAARITPLLGGEQVQADRLQGVQTVSIRVRSDSATRRVETGWRIMDITAIDGAPRDIAYAIKAIMNVDEKNIWLEFTCQSGIPG